MDRKRKQGSRPESLAREQVDAAVRNLGAGDHPSKATRQELTVGRQRSGLELGTRRGKGAASPEQWVLG